MHVLERSIVPSQAFIKYDIVVVEDGRFSLPDNCLHVFGVYTIDQEDAIKSIISEASGMLTLYPVEDPYSGMSWMNMDDFTTSQIDGIPFVITRDTIQTESILDELILMYASIEENENGDILVDEKLLLPIVAYIKFKNAERLTNMKFNKSRRIYPNDRAYVDELHREYARQLRLYRSEKFEIEDKNYSRNAGK